MTDTTQPPLTLPPITTPGQPLAPSPPYSPSTGTHLNPDKKTISASLTGVPTLNPTTNQISIEIPAPRTRSASASARLPSVGDTVLARVTRVHPRQASVEIFAFADAGGVGGGGVCVDTFHGVIRRQDVRTAEKDKVKVLESFRGGDVVRAVVISLGDQANYYLSTGSNSLGVVVGYSDDGDLLYPVNWRQMACARTGVVEDRKVAKPI